MNASIVLLVVMVVVSIIGFSNEDFRNKYLFIPYNVKHYQEWYRFFSHPFLHGDVGHLFFNAFTFYNFGPMIEEYFLAMYDEGPGRLFYWIFIFASMYASASISYFRHKDNEYYRSLGFSGVVSAVLFAFIMLAPFASLSLMFIPIPIPAWFFGLAYLGFEIYSDRNRKTNIAHDAHIAGAVFGILFILITNIEQVMANFNALVS